MSELNIKPSVDPTSDAAWLKRKIDLHERAEREARQQLAAAQDQLAAAQDQLAYYRQWLAELTESEARR